MRMRRGRGRPPSCGRHHQGIAGWGNISDLNQITDIDWEDQTYSRNLISSWDSLRVQLGPPFSCNSTSALGSPSSSAPLEVHLGRGGLPFNTVTLYCFINLLFADIPCPPDYNVLISWIREWSLFSLQTLRSNSADSSSKDIFHNHYNSTYMNPHQKLTTQVKTLFRWLRVHIHCAVLGVWVESLFPMSSSEGSIQRYLQVWMKMLL